MDPHSSLYHLLNRQWSLAGCNTKLTRDGVTAFRLFSRHGATHGRAKSFDRNRGGSDYSAVTAQLQTNREFNDERDDRDGDFWGLYLARAFRERM